MKIKIRILSFLLLVSLNLVGAESKVTIEKDDAKKIRAINETVQSGANLSLEKFKALKIKIDKSKDPLNLNDKIRFMAYCNNEGIYQERVDKLLFEMINKNPKNDFFMFNKTSIYDYPSIDNLKSKATNLWLDKVNNSPKDYDLLWCAANFFKTVDPKSSVKFLEKGKKLDKNNLKWYKALGECYYIVNNGKLAYENFKFVYDNEDKNSLQKIMLLGDLTRTAYISKNYFAAKKYAMLAIKNSYIKTSYGVINNTDLYFIGNTVLGLIALKNNDIEEASKYLIKSVDKTVFPKMNLAKELFNKGEKKVVISFLKKCSLFWDKKMCEKWIKKIKSNKTPDFKYYVEPYLN
ncbi:hypothetical protein AAEX28_15560 [Lentisphaerota bacterium WC36G]|nr:hypothetical protein LJT99_02320 [Lentisphaerae bacterium WC36]